MHLFFQELKQARRGLVLWSLCQAALIGMGYLEFTQVFRDNIYVGEIMEELPAAFLALMGTSAGVNFSLVGDFFFAMADFGFYVMAAYACLLGHRMLSREETEGTTEFLLAKPMGRGAILLWKCGAGAVCCLGLGLVTVTVTALTFGMDPGGDLLEQTLVWGVTSVVLTLVYFLAGVLFGAACARPATGSALTLLFLFGTIVLSRMVGFLGLSGPVKLLSAKDYFPMVQYAQTGAFGVQPWLLCGGWMVLFTAVALWRYRRRDL